MSSKAIGRSRVQALWLGTGVFLTVALATSVSFAQSTRGAMPVLGLRAPDGEDEAAAMATSSLRRSVTQQGYEVPAESPNLEQLVAAFGCDDSVPVECLRQVADHIHSTRFVYGAVRRAGPRRSTAPVRLEVMVYDNGTISQPQQTELPRAQAVDQDRWSGATTQMVTVLLPAQAAMGTGNGNGNVIAPPPVVGPPSAPLPIRRYIGFGAMGAGVVLGVVGAVMGVQWLGLTGSIAADATVIEMQGMRSTDPSTMNVRNFNDIGVRGMPMAGGDAVCREVSSGRTDNLVFANNPNRVVGAGSAELMSAQTVCSQSGSLLLNEALFLGIGAGLVAIGAVLVITDSTGSAPPPAAAGTRASRRRAPTRGAWTVAPVLSPTTQGAVLHATF